MNRRTMSSFGPRFIAMSMVAAAIIIAAALVAKGFERGSAMRIVMALVQGAASAFVAIGSVRSIRRLDEMQQRIQLEALAFSFAGTGVLATGYGFLESAGLPAIEWGSLVWPVMVALWAAGMLVACRRYR